MRDTRGPDAPIPDSVPDELNAIYGAEAGNLALKLMAAGGVWLGGGIAPKILPKLEDGTFTRAFADKGRFRPLLERIPVRVMLRAKPATSPAARERSTAADSPASSQIARNGIRNVANSSWSRVNRQVARRSRAATGASRQFCPSRVRS